MIHQTLTHQMHGFPSLRRYGAVLSRIAAASVARRQKLAEEASEIVACLSVSPAV